MFAISALVVLGPFKRVKKSKFSGIKRSTVITLNHELGQESHKLLVPYEDFDNFRRIMASSRKHLRTKVTPDFHLTYSKNGGNLGL